MPINPLIGAALIGAGSSAFGGLATGNLNKKTRQFNERMMREQRQWALQDWNMTNQYNDPSQQMARLASAGLNPHLIYGKGAGDMTSAMVRSSPSADWNPKAPDWGSVASGAGSALLAFQDVKLKGGQLNNLQEQNKLIAAQALNTYADTAKKMGETAKTQFDLHMAKSLERSTLEAAQENVRKLQIGNVLALTEEQRKVALHAPTLAAAVQNVANLKAQNDLTTAQSGLVKQNIANAIKDGTLKDFEISLNKRGLTKGDPAYMRIISDIISAAGSGISLKTVTEGIKRSWKFTGKPFGGTAFGF